MTAAPLRITADWLQREPLQTVLGLFAPAGQRGLIVGGAVRNALLGLSISDIDIATDAPPATVMALAQAAGLKTIPTGIDHGTVTVIAQGTAFEITTFRRDVTTDGRHARVSFSQDIHEDAARRDFTMNALYAHADGTVLDPLGTGLEDIAEAHVRFVGTPQTRIREDYLRILRFFRFTALYGAPRLGPDPEGLAACAELAEGVDQVSRERVGHEMCRLLAAPDPAPAVAAMAASGVLPRVLPGAEAQALPLLVHFESLLDVAPAWLCRLAALGGTEAAARLRLSRAHSLSLHRISQAARDTTLSAAVLGYRLGAQEGLQAALLRQALLQTPPAANLRAQIARGAAARFPLKAADLPAGLTGPEIGRRLRLAEARWIASDFSLTHKDLCG